MVDTDDTTDIKKEPKKVHDQVNRDYRGERVTSLHAISSWNMR